MTREDIIRMAREAGVSESELFPGEQAIERFAALVAAAEREACARVCEDMIGTRAMARHCADAIRAMQKPTEVDCCANCLRPKREHRGNKCPHPYTTIWNAWDYDFPPKGHK